MNAIETIENTLDYYHSMDIDSDYEYWNIAWEVAYDLLERIQGLPEHSLYNAHIKECESCQERGLGKKISVFLSDYYNVGG